jgi:hypothetical protein
MKHIPTFESFLGETTLEEGATISGKRIDDAVHAAEYAFWSEVAGSFPEVKTGDFSPSDSVKLQKAMKEAILSWVKINS